ncbi:MAG: DUF5134 domain-containing protein [Acidimicrobiia bacterium]
MARPTWLGYGFAVLMVGVSVYCIGRLLVAKRWGRQNHYDVNVSHVLMGFAMVGMLVPRWNPIPNAVWVPVFVLITLWFFGLSARFVAAHGASGTDDAHVHHLSHFLVHGVMAAAMVYMYWVGVPATGPSGMMSMTSAGGVPPGYLILSFFFVVVLFGSALWQLDAISRFAPQQLAFAGASSSASGVRSGGPSRGAVLIDDAGDVSIVGGERWLAPRLEMACHISMCLAMGYMLVLML